MARQKQSPFEDVVEIVAKFPWWVGVAGAAVAYLLLHPIAVMDIAASANPKDIGVSVSKAMFRSLATLMQYLLPAAFLIGALVSLFARYKRKSLHDDVATADTRSALEAMSWREFELLVGEHFRRQGFSVEETGGGGADGGVDLVLSRGSDRYLVQCKQWKARQVGVAPVRELYGVMAAKGAAGGYVVTSGIFTDEAQRFAEGREIEFIDGSQLIEMIRGATLDPGSKSGMTTPGSLDPGSKSGMTTPGSLDPGSKSGMTTAGSLDPGSRSGVTTKDTEVPSCPQCGSPMVLRTAQRGSNAGSSFWGCSTFPKCRGTRAV